MIDLTRRQAIRAMSAAAASAILMSGCERIEDSDEASSASTDGEVSLEGRSLVFAGYDAFRPFRYIETQEDGSEKVVGLDIAVADELASRLGFTYTFDAMPFASILAAVQNQQADFSMGFTQNEEREEVYDFTQGYFQPRVGVVSTADLEVNDIDDLRGHSVGVVTGTVQYTMAEELLADEDIQSYDSSDLCLQELLSGRIDAYICDGAEAVYMAEPHDSLRSNVLDEEFSTEYLGEYHMMGWKGADFIPVFDETLTEMKEDGTLDSLIEEWVGTDFTYGA